jgi:hypothetical protein
MNGTRQESFKVIDFGVGNVKISGSNTIILVKQF